MTMTPVLLDTDVLSAIMHRESPPTARARVYLLEHSRFTFSVVTRYEVLRGLRATGAVRQQQEFEQLCAVSIVLPLTDEIAHQAARIYAELHMRGELIGDADILIAATAMVHGLAVATNNHAHFRRIDQLVVENWLRSYRGPARWG